MNIYLFCETKPLWYFKHILSMYQHLPECQVTLIYDDFVINKSAENIN